MNEPDTSRTAPSLIMSAKLFGSSAFTPRNTAPGYPGTTFDAPTSATLSDGRPWVAVGIKFAAPSPRSTAEYPEPELCVPARARWCAGEPGENVIAAADPRYSPGTPGSAVDVKFSAP